MLACCACDTSALPADRVEGPVQLAEEGAEFPFALKPDTAPDSPGCGAQASPFLAEASFEEKFEFLMTRATPTTNWGIDFQSDSERSLTVRAVEQGQAMAQCNKSARFYAAKPLKPGDVIVSVDGATSQAAMVEKLKKETSLTAEIVRYLKFDAVIDTDSSYDAAKPTQKSFGMQVSRVEGKLMICKIDSGPSPIKCYNTKNYLKPLVSGDVIVAVDSKTTFDEMIEQIKTSTKVTLSIERRQQFGQKVSVVSHVQAMPERPIRVAKLRADSGGVIAEAA
jgi:hypothetical protein